MARGVRGNSGSWLLQLFSKAKTISKENFYLKNDNRGEIPIISIIAGTFSIFPTTGRMHPALGVAVIIACRSHPITASLSLFFLTSLTFINYVAAVFVVNVFPGTECPISQVRCDTLKASWPWSLELLPVLSNQCFNTWRAFLCSTGFLDHVLRSWGSRVNRGDYHFKKAYVVRFPPKGLAPCPGTW